MEEIFICTECIQIANEPVKLDCVHVFCLKCAQLLSQVNFINTMRKDVFVCPVCNINTELTGDKVFQINEDLKLAVNHYSILIC